MKLKYFLYGLAVSLLLVSCYSEDALHADDDEYGAIRFNFPQGNNTWDDDIVKIADDFGIYIIYKDITIADMNRSWITANYTYWADPFDSDANIEWSVNFLRDHIFAHLTPEVIKGVFPPYYYLVQDCYYNLPPSTSYRFQRNIFFNKMMPAGGMDFMLTCQIYTEEKMIERGLNVADGKTPETPVEFWNRRGPILYPILRLAVSAGNIVVPAEFLEGFDYITPINRNFPDPNNAWTRGMVTVSDLWGYFWQGTTRPTPEANFFQYMHMTMFFNDEGLEEWWPEADYPFLRSKQRFVRDYLKQEYGLDLDAVRASGYSLTPFMN
ncbi:MAG: hypothetical protein FWE10_02995 [Rikenellaceae bacterium]|nr:hypothetical protein [Rikenellaceae bacterium]MCL2693127.1 hypothetical protein [Rikenellaceae bacterium]